MRASAPLLALALAACDVDAPDPDDACPAPAPLALERYDRSCAAAADCALVAAPSCGCGSCGDGAVHVSEVARFDADHPRPCCDEPPASCGPCDEPRPGCSAGLCLLFIGDELTRSPCVDVGADPGASREVLAAGATWARVETDPTGFVAFARAAAGFTSAASADGVTFEPPRPLDGAGGWHELAALRRTPDGFRAFVSVDGEGGATTTIAETTSPDGVTWSELRVVYETLGLARDAAGLSAPRVVEDLGPRLYYTAHEPDDAAVPGLPPRSVVLAYEDRDGPFRRHEVLLSASSCAGPGTRQWQLVDVVRPTCARCRTEERWLLVIRRPCPGGDDEPTLELHGFGHASIPPIALGPVRGTPTTALLDDLGLWVYGVDDAGALVLEQFAIDPPAVLCWPF